MRNTLVVPSTTTAFFVRAVDDKGRSTLTGAEITLFINGSQVPLNKRLVDAGSGYNSQNVLPLHFAVPMVTQVYAEVRVKSPKGEKVISSVAIDLAKWRNRVFEIRIPSTPSGF